MLKAAAAAVIVIEVYGNVSKRVGRGMGEGWSMEEIFVYTVLYLLIRMF